jgi:hypothetical protein
VDLIEIPATHGPQDFDNEHEAAILERLRDARMFNDVSAREVEHIEHISRSHYRRHGEHEEDIWPARKEKKVTDLETVLLYSSPQNLCKMYRLYQKDDRIFRHTLYTIHGKEFRKWNAFMNAVIKTFMEFAEDNVDYTDEMTRREEFVQRSPDVQLSITRCKYGDDCKYKNNGPRGCTHFHG